MTKPTAPTTPTTVFNGKWPEISVHDERIVFDPSYNRVPKVATLRKMAKNGWFHDLCDPLVFNERPSGYLACVDGQHRHALAVSLGIPTVPYRTIKIPVAMEAQIYRLAQQNKTANTSLEAWKAESLYHPPVIEMNRIITDEGFLMDTEYNKCGINSLSCPDAIHKIYNIGGERVLRSVLQFIKSCYPNEKLARNQFFMRGLADFMVNNASHDESCLVRKFLTMPLTEIIQSGKSFSKSLGWSVPKGMSFAIFNGYNRHQKSKYKLPNTHYLKVEPPEEKKH